MFTLAHAHGAALAFVNIAAGVTTRTLSGGALASSASRALVAGSVLLPLGFFLGGVVIHEGDPGLGIILAPVGAVALIYAIARIARDVSRTRE